MKHSIQQEFRGVATFVGSLWVIFLIGSLLPVSLTAWGIVPRTWWGLFGIPLAPFLHLGLGHLVSNTIPLLVLLSLLAGSRTNTWGTVAEIILLSGGLLWLVGRSAVHVGASGLIYGLIAFLIVSGFREKRIVPLLVAILVGFLYGGTLLSGILPTAGPQVSWDGHLSGAVAGSALGYFTVAGDTRGTASLPGP